MVIIIVLIAIVFIILFVLLFIYFSKKRKEKERKTVFKTSITIKKLQELNEKFPDIDVSYVHSHKETIYVKRRYDVYHFEPDIYFEKAKPILMNDYKTKVRNLYLYEEYLKLFQETKEQSKTPNSIIHETHINFTKYKTIENEYIRSLFRKKKDTEEITYLVQAHYVSPKGRNRLSSHGYIYTEKSFAQEPDFPPIEIDYSPNYCQKKEKAEIKEGINKEKEEIKLDEFSLDGYLYHIEEDSIYLIGVDPSIQDVVIKDKILFEGTERKVMLKDSAFLGNKNIKTLNLEEGREEIPNSCFKNCITLESVCFPSTLKKIGKKAFSGCLSLKEARIPESIVCISEEAFSLCSSLQNLYFPSTIKKVGPSILWYSNKAKIHILSGKNIDHFDPEWNVEDNPVVFE